MKIMYLNVYLGCEEKERFEKIIAFVNKEKPDVLGLSELQGWRKNDFAKMKFFQKECGFVDTAFCDSPNGYDVALFSRLPIESKDSLGEGFYNGFAKVSVRSGGEMVDVAVVHASPKSEDQRLKEFTLFKEKLDSKKPLVLMGDMNALSPFDVYDESALLAKMKEFGKAKFGTTHLRREFIQHILDFGLVDAVDLFSEKSEGFLYSVPTPYNKDKAHFGKLRLDYLFVSAALKEKVRSAQIVRTPETDQLSDHYPVVLALEL